MHRTASDDRRLESRGGCAKRIRPWEGGVGPRIKPQAWFLGRSEERRFALCLTALGALVFIGYRESVLGAPLAGLCVLTAKAVFAALQMLGVPATLSHTILSHPDGFACEIYFRCTGFLPVVCLTVAIWASPGLARRKLAGIALGVPLLLALNLLRVVHVFVVGVTRPDLFTLVHGVVWEAAIVAAWDKVMNLDRFDLA